MSLPPGAELFVGMFIILGVIVFFPYIIKFIRFTGLWLLPVEVLLIDTLLVGKVLKLEMNVSQTGCIGVCRLEPIVEVAPGIYKRIRDL